MPTEGGPDQASMQDPTAQRGALQGCAAVQVSWAGKGLLGWRKRKVGLRSSTLARVVGIGAWALPGRSNKLGLSTRP